MIKVGEYKIILSFREMFADKYFFDLWISKKGEKSTMAEICYNKSSKKVEMVNSIIREFLIEEISRFIESNYFKEEKTKK